MFLSLLKGKRGVLAPFSVSFALLVFMSLIGVEWEVSLVLSSFTGVLLLSENVARSLWEDYAIFRMVLRFRREVVVVIVSSLIAFFSLLLNVLLAALVSLMYSVPLLFKSPGLLVWSLSSSLICTTLSIIGEMSGVSLSFMAAVLQLPLLIGFYGYLSAESPPTYLGLMAVMGLFYLSLMITFSDEFLEI